MVPIEIRKIIIADREEGMTIKSMEIQLKSGIVMTQRIAFDDSKINKERPSTACVFFHIRRSVFFDYLSFLFIHRHFLFDRQTAKTI